ncbi:rhodanese domain-containing protein [Caenimonas sp. SL110]|uniref:oxygen-dependent tRNA uridine(34) hydroxylase TrhO n=1 Tax=Caenimonas sp. SL110 TaxID=1450524 RepID=UPI000A6BA393|nr:rhodanese-like domain-containing protein [Caenimonas sp. SL110]
MHPNDDLVHTAFYKFSPLADPEQVAAALRELLASQGPGAVTGSVLVAPEGINGMLAGTQAVVTRVEQALLGDAVFSGAFSGMVFKRSDCITRPFAKLKVHVKKEIVPLGIDGVDARQTGIDVSPQEWRELIRQPDVVLLDNRNSFEYRLGHFEGAIDPLVQNFRDFPEYVRAHVDEWKAQGKRVAMYCTGGIRCEKTSAWMREMDMPVYQLEGGILNFFQQMPDAQRDWTGECFVFDNRVALDTKLHETSTTLEDVYQGEPDGQWRLQRARRLALAGEQ